MLRASQPRTVLGYELCETIGEGAHGKVKLAFDPVSRDPVAIKIVQKKPGKEGARHIANLDKEIRIHSSVRHENIIALLNAGQDDTYVYIVMEFAAAGELFDRIEPDVGVDEELAHMYFQQLIAGMEYIHGQGYTHRDLKPENILLDQFGNLKISDFGLATKFMHEGKRRILKTPCGTPPYVAPEIHTMLYHGDAVDIWATGIILYVLLAGNTPWGEPTKHDEEFMYFLRHYASGLRYAPWNTFPKDALDLLRGILAVDPEGRYTVRDIKRNRWFARDNSLLTDGRCNDPARVAERMLSQIPNGDDVIEASQIISYSQPSDIRSDAYQSGSTLFDDRPGYASFSQPMRMDQDTPTQYTQYERGAFPDLFPSVRLTRFYSNANPDSIRQTLEKTLQSFLVPHKTNPISRKIGFTTVDKRKCPLHGEINIQPVTIQSVGEVQLVSFRKSKGDPLEFKRFYRGVLTNVEDLVLREAL